MYKKVLVTGIGGNVGQGIIRNIHHTTFDIVIIGTNVNDFSAGNHLCDTFYKVPFAYEDSYIMAIKNIVTKENIDLIIPSTDYEEYYLSLNQKKIGCRVVASSPSTSEAYLDKYLTHQLHRKFDIPFASTFLPSEYDFRFSDFIVKPRKGRGSRDLFYNPKDLSQFIDNDFIVQELIQGIEITTGFYVDKKSKLHGQITLIRTLYQGVTYICSVTREFDEQIIKILNKIIQNIPIKGSANIQSIVKSDGDIIPFEVNCRISGTNSVRSNFGFEDVKYTLEEYLYDQEPSQVSIKNGVAVRILMDVIYPGQTDINYLDNNKPPFYIY